ncbi:MAG TPA: AAA family ATPase [Phycisphaerae bacterium]|nr:AAA family ATPase [Phycisphaerae bacterium]
MSLDADRLRLAKLMDGGCRFIFAPTHEEDEVLSLVRDYAVRNPVDLWVWTVVDGLRDGLVSDQPPIADTTSAAAALYYLRRSGKKGIAVMLDMLSYLRDERTLRVVRDLLPTLAKTESTLILIDHQDELPPVLAADAIRFEIALPNENQVESVVKETLQRHHRIKPILVDVKRSQYQAIIRNLRGLSRRRIARIIEETITDDRRFEAADLHTVLARKREAISAGGLLVFVETPVDMSEVAGMRRLKRWLKQRQSVMAVDDGLSGLAPPRGVLLLGVQGAGKSFCAKAIATAWQRPLLRVDVGALYDKYIGESERRLRDALHQAEAMAPIILWIDEIEKGFASAASRSTDGGLSQRMFGELLTWMQEHRAPVFVVATANDIEALPPELLRKGRFDEIFFVDLPDEETRRELWDIHLRKRRRDPAAYDVAGLVTASQGYSGAEIEQATIAAMYNAVDAKRELTNDDLLRALKESPPLSATLAERVAALRAWAVGRCVPADEA